jgi:predicted nucleic acid-binding protein
MKRVFIDTNILLDLLLERQPWVHQASVLFSMADRKELDLLCCSLSFSTAVFHCCLSDASSKIQSKRDNHQVDYRQIPLYGYNR